jgi:6-phosphogluconolactonase
VDKARQEGPHAHSINLDPTNRRALVADLGLDKIMIYDFDPNKGRLTPHDPPFATVTPGAGPRHLAFHPDGRHAYVINEMHNTVTAFTYNPRQGVLKPFQTVSTLPEQFKGTSYAAEVVVHPSGKFLYGSNRGHDSLAIFTVDPQTGGLTPGGHQTGIKVPRNFVIDSAGDFLLAANQGASSIAVYRIDRNSGQLTGVGKPVPVPDPVCIRLIPLGK